MSNIEICMECKPSIREIIKMNEDELKKFLISHGLITDIMKCPNCQESCNLYNESIKKPDRSQTNYEKISLTNKRLYWRCQKTKYVQGNKRKKLIKCNFMSSFWAHTFFAKSQLSIEDIIHFVVFFITSNAPKTDLLQDEFGFSRKTVIDWVNFMHEVLLDWSFRNNSLMIGGEGKVVEVSESKLGGLICNGERVYGGQWVIGGIERSSKKMFIIPIKTRDEETLIQIIRKTIAPGTKIVSDLWKSYDSPPQECFLSLEGELLIPTNHSESFIDQATDANTQNIERCFRYLKRKIPKNKLTEEHYSNYIAEFLFVRAYPNIRDRIHQIFREISIMYDPTRLNDKRNYYEN
ncbi:uncharacterized protein LOC123304235 [Chrysoperla carnea]|uniref:uncharacterized protein LOC123304235 n=1 Tax=Chrysoperla carnea TaxID=189513 RepID=UPI001D094B31|nr:uncharacterized protein LOC123304235 [Chrysoperla carnea]